MSCRYIAIGIHFREIVSGNAIVEHGVSSKNGLSPRHGGIPIRKD